MSFGYNRNTGETLKSWAIQLKKLNTTALTSVTDLISVTNRVTVLESAYSLKEVNTGIKWIDGKQIYRKVVDVGALPNATTTNTAHGITYENVISISGFGLRSSDDKVVPIPYVDPNAVGNNMGVVVNTTNVQIFTGTNFSAYDGHVILEYTKT